MIINSLQTAIDLFEKRGAMYSDRAHFVSADIIGYSDLTPMLPYGDRLKKQRKFMSQAIGTRPLLDRLAPLQEHEVHRYLLRLLKRPEDFEAHTKKRVVFAC